MEILKDKAAIITGASSGIGHASARLFAREGAKVVVGARREAELQRLVEEIRHNGGEAIHLAGDVTDETYAQELVALAVSQYGKLDIAFNNAGSLGKTAAVKEKSLADWNQELATNLTSSFLGAKYQIPAMQKHGGAILFTSSFVGYTIGFPGTAAYAAAKAGLLGLTKTLALEGAPHNIRVNALLPGGTETPMAQEFGDSPEVKEFVRSIHALKRTAQPEELAQAALFLVSDQASFATGSSMLVDGGVSICKT